MEKLQVHQELMSQVFNEKKTLENSVFFYVKLFDRYFFIDETSKMCYNIGVNKRYITLIYGGNLWNMLAKV